MLQARCKVLLTNEALLQVPVYEEDTTVSKGLGHCQAASQDTLHASIHTTAEILCLFNGCEVSILYQIFARS